MNRYTFIAAVLIVLSLLGCTLYMVTRSPPSSTHVTTTASTGGSVVVHQVWIHPQWTSSDGLHGLPERYHAPVQSWRAVYGDQGHRVYDRTECRRVFSTVFPQHVQTYDNLHSDVERADLARYAIMYAYGGFYADIDTTLMRPIRPFVDDLNMHVSIEIRQSDGMHGYVQYAFGSPANPPALSDIVAEVVWRTQSAPPATHQHPDARILWSTGPMGFSTAINRRLHNHHRPNIVVHREGVFGAYKSGDLFRSTAYIKHHFDGSWKRSWGDNDRDW